MPDNRSKNRFKPQAHSIKGPQNYAQFVQRMAVGSDGLTETSEMDAYHLELFESASIGLQLCTMSGDIVYVNQAFAKLMGYTIEAVSQLTYWEVTPRSYEPQEQIQLQSLETIGRYGPYEKEYIHSEGHLIPVRLSGVLIERNGQQLIWSSIEDISDRKEVEAALSQKNQELEKALKTLQQAQTQIIQSEKMSSLGQLVAGIAHEINNPVSFIHGNVTHTEQYTQEILNLLNLYKVAYPFPPAEIAQKLAEMDLPFLTEDLQKLLTSMRSGTSRIREIVKSLRMFSRLDEAGVKTVDIHDGLDSTLMILENRLGLQPGVAAIEVVKQYDCDIPVECYAGPLNQVFMNILVNGIDALDHLRQKRGEKTPCITITTSKLDNHWIKIAISDNGIGMSEAIQARIFDPFFTTKPVGQGTGMGMAISYQLIVEKHQGTLDCHSVLGEGSKFIIRIPMFQDEG
jgi:PAS domain S-box-containing protein